MGHAEVRAAGLGKLVGQKNGKPPISAHEQNLLHRPHGIGKALCRHLVGVAAHIDVFLHQLPEDARADAQRFGVLLGIDVEVDVHRVHHAGGGQNAHLPAEQAVQRHVPAVLGQQIGAQLPAAQQKDAHTAFQRAVHPGALGVVHRAGKAAQPLLFFRGQLLPERKRTGQAPGVRRCFCHTVHPFRSALAASVPASAPS